MLVKVFEIAQRERETGERVNCLTAGDLRNIAVKRTDRGKEATWIMGEENLRFGFVYGFCKSRTQSYPQQWSLSSLQ